jgi:hypothetical protein
MPSQLGSSFTPQAPQRKYDFHHFDGHDLADGGVWRLEKGRDYDCSETNLRQHVRRFAAEHGLDFEFHRVRSGRGVVAIELAFALAGSPLPGRAQRSVDDANGGGAGRPSGLEADAK